MSSNLLNSISSNTINAYWRPLQQKCRAHPIATALILGSVGTIAAMNAYSLWNRLHVVAPAEDETEPTTESTPKQTILAKLKEAQRQATKHRTDDEFYPPEVPLPIISNYDFFGCDKQYSKLFHKLAAQFFSAGNLKEYEPMMREKVHQLLLNEPNLHNVVNEYIFQMFSEILLGYKGSLLESQLSLDIASYVFPLSDPNKFRAAIQDDPRISDFQAHNFIDIMWNITRALTNSALRDLMIRASLHPELQEKAFKAANQKDLDDQILRFIIEEERLGDRSDVIRRGPLVSINIAHFATSEEIVGENPDAFNPDRYQQLPSSWYGFSWMPFGRGPNHSCPGMEFHKYLAKHWLQELFLNYRLEAFNASGESVTFPNNEGRKIKTIVLKSRTEPGMEKTYRFR